MSPLKGQQVDELGGRIAHHDGASAVRREQLLLPPRVVEIGGICVDGRLRGIEGLHFRRPGAVAAFAVHEGLEGCNTRIGPAHESGEEGVGEVALDGAGAAERRAQEASEVEERCKEIQRLDGRRNARALEPAGNARDEGHVRQHIIQAAGVLLGRVKVAAVIAMIAAEEKGSAVDVRARIKSVQNHAHEGVNETHAAEIDGSELAKERIVEFFEVSEGGNANRWVQMGRLAWRETRSGACEATCAAEYME